MSVTINVNGLSLCHKGSDGRIDNTLPDVCKTPDKGIPVPYKNRAFSKDLVKGTTSCFADGGNMVANFGSEFAVSIFDESGSMGGIVSGTNKAEAEWITYSASVFFEKKPACRLTDKMFMNHRNTVSLAGLKQRDLPKEDQEFYDELCKMACDCLNALKGKLKPGQTYQDCLNKKIVEKYYDGRYPKRDGKVWREVPFDRGNGWNMIQQQGGNLPTSNYIRPNSRRLDIARVGKDGISKLLDIKFPGDKLGFEAERDYRRIAKDLTGDADNFEEFNIEDNCDCSNGGGDPGNAPVAVPAAEKESFMENFGRALEESTGIKLAGGALVAFLIVSELSRIIPVRNAIPVP